MNDETYDETILNDLFILGHEKAVKKMRRMKEKEMKCCVCAGLITAVNLRSKQQKASISAMLNCSSLVQVQHKRNEFLVI